MVTFCPEHIVILIVSFALFVGSAYLVSKLTRIWQNVMFVFAAAACSGLIFFNCGMGLTFEGAINWKGLAIQMLQVCQFNMILTPLMLVSKFELARQYSVMFAMFAALTTFFSLPEQFATRPWYDHGFLNFWIFHWFAIALPVWMVAARRLKPRKKYILPVTGCVFAYFTVVYIVCEQLKATGILAADASFSFIYKSGHTFPLKQLYDLIGVPYFYLWPLIPLAAVFFWFLAWIFRSYKVDFVTEYFPNTKTK